MNTPNTITDKENERIENFLELLKINPEAIESQIIKNEYKNIVYEMFENVKKRGSEYVLKFLNLLNLGKLNNLLNNNEIENICRGILITSTKSMEMEDSGDWAVVIEELLGLNVLDKKEIKRKCEEFLDSNINYSPRSLQNISILKLDIWDKEEIKEKYKEKYINLLNKLSNIKLGAANFMCSLLKLDIREKGEIEEKVRDLLNKALEKTEQDSDWGFVVVNILSLNVLKNEEIKEISNYLLDISIKNANEYDFNMAHYVIPKLLELKTIDKKNIEHKYRDLLDIMLKQSETDQYEAVGYLELLDSDILGKEEFKERYINMLIKAFSRSKNSLEWTKTTKEIIKGNIFDKNDKEIFEKLLNMAFTEIRDEEKKDDKPWRDEWLGIIIKLLDMDVLNPQEKKDKYKELILSIVLKPSDYISGLVKSLYEAKFDDSIKMPQNVGYPSFVFLEKNKDKIDIEDINFVTHINDIFTDDEVNYLYRQDYEYFKGIEIAVKENSYQKIWEVKKEAYPQEEKDKLHQMEEYFGKGVWTYFVDKVPGNKILKNRFRDSHNALLHSASIVNLAEDLHDKGFSKHDFIKNYLGVAGDRNNGYQQLNDFIEKYKSDWKESVEEAMNIYEFKENTEFMNLAEGILEKEKTGELYKNLDNLEQILTLLHMIRNKDALIKLQRLENSDNPNDKKLYEYYKGAIYHPRTKPIIMKMYEDPGEFLGLDDTTFSSLEKIHQAKKPSNMVENFEFLDFDAKDLVDCLPLGIYDQLSYFKPFEMKFYISGSDVFTKEEIQQKVSEFLLGADQKKISVIITKLKEQGDETMWFKEWKANKEEFVKNLLGKYGSEDLINMFVNLGYSEFNKYKDLREMTAKISPKSDPNNWFNGFNCDSLAEGHGKKVVAMFNPYCTDFCIYEGDQDPKEDNLKVTSRVTLNRAIPENFTTLLGKLKSETTHDIVSVLGDKFEDYRDPSEYVITMDNIEANPNFGKKNELAVRKMYEKFFSEYVRQNPISPNGIPINTSKFYSGVNFNKLDILTDSVPNESLPVFVNAYSDNSESYSLQGNLDAGEQKEKQKKVGIHPLSIEDVVQISYMEGKIYPSSMKDHLGNLQHEITASILNNTLKNRSNLSFAWYNEEGKIGGYILAYQGKMEDGTPGVYISDFAIDEKERGTAGIKMIHHWMEEVKKNYPNMPIFTRARENTSYRMVKAFAERKGYEIAEDEIMEDGGENFHRVVMNTKNQEVDG